MMANRTRRFIDAAYTIGVIVKGIDGAIEFVVGTLLLVAPGLVHSALSAVASEAREGSSATTALVSDYVARLDAQLARSGLAFLIAFLLIHGVVKLVLVYCLLRKFHRVYPIAIGVLGVFLVYQAYAFVTAPSIGLALFTVLDALIIFFVYREYRQIRPPKRRTGSEPTARPVN
ncbi:DUF2127 domain-containing protein [Lacisediminihabitans profunda]|uniref:DUF2127 domain-containing protein n=1 Tax=Lacisediminihabitans profunda TaxID=2594790 RepID=A0A5C8UU76_9MICO|nr:DUF2127 domain-containing protein [Lacisediminihabitans profunda]TXN31901.1 DUF2127 domain-containing protein [Lacisediminihabitans profunda]